MPYTVINTTRKQIVYMNTTITRYLLAAAIVLGLSTLSCDRNSRTVPKTEEGYKSVNGTRLYYQTIGSGEPLMIVHGGPLLDHGYLAPYLKPLADRYRLIFFDQRLSGRSSSEVDSSEVTLDYFVEDMEALRKAFRVDSMHLAGHSWGGMLAMKYAIKYPGNLRSLLLLNSMPASTDLWMKEQQALANRITPEDSLRRAEIMATSAFKNRESAAIEKLLIHSFRSQFHRPQLADSLDLFIPDNYSKRSGLFSLLMPELSRYDLHPDLRKLQVPTLLVYGAIEPAASISGIDLDTTLTNSKLVTVPESGHFPFLEQPDIFLREMRAFLEIQ